MLNLSAMELDRARKALGPWLPANGDIAEGIASLRLRVRSQAPSAREVPPVPKPSPGDPEHIGDILPRVLSDIECNLKGDAV